MARMSFQLFGTGRSRPQGLLQASRQLALRLGSARPLVATHTRGHRSGAC